MDLEKIGREVVNWIQLSQDGGQGRERGDVVMKLCFHKVLGII
jgi:hypothetical protein